MNTNPAIYMANAIPRVAIFITAACAIINKKMKKRYQFAPSVPISKYIFYYFNFPTDGGREGRGDKKLFASEVNTFPTRIIRLTWSRVAAHPEASSTVLLVSNRLCHRRPRSNSPSARRSSSWDRSDRAPRPRGLARSRWITPHDEIILDRDRRLAFAQDSQDISLCGAKLAYISNTAGYRQFPVDRAEGTTTTGDYPEWLLSLHG